MALSSESKFSMKVMSDAINRLPTTASQIRELGIFTPKFLTTTYARIEDKDGVLTLVQSSPRGSMGEASATARRTKRTFEIPHFVRNDIIRADEIQNLHAFGSEDKFETVESVVNDRLQTMRGDLDLTREHLQLGALLGDIRDADGTVLFNIYNEFGLKRQTFNWKLNVKTTAVGALMDDAKRQLRKKSRGELINGFIALCSPEFLDKLKYHDSLKEIVKEYKEGALYREDTGAMFEYNGIKFIEYYGDFGNDAAKIDAGDAILLPAGTRNTFAEYFAPADTNSAVNTKALAYYAQREKLELDKGWRLEAQTNSLPLVLRPELVATLKAE